MEHIQFKCWGELPKKNQMDVMVSFNYEKLSNFALLSMAPSFQIRLHMVKQVMWMLGGLIVAQVVHLLAFQNRTVTQLKQHSS